MQCATGLLSEPLKEETLDLHRFQVLAATTENEAYNALVCSEFSPELGRDAVYQLGDAAGDDPAALPATLRGRAIFESGLGVEELNRRAADGWRLEPIPFTAGDGFEAFKASMPAGADLLLLRRADGKIRFFTHASRPVPRAGDTVLAHLPPPPKEPHDATSDWSRAGDGALRL